MPFQSEIPGAVTKRIENICVVDMCVQLVISTLFDYILVQWAASGIQLRHFLVICHFI